jgi:LmbE family N-acetylglucosaminyl deacetylase
VKTFLPLAPVIIISPHLDDGVLSCAQLIDASSDVTVVTVLAGAPNEHHEGYNSRSTGENFAPNAMKRRRAEDADALSLLSSKFEWLDFLDGDYMDERPRVDDDHVIRDAIVRVLRKENPVSVISPLGLYHDDHLLVSDVCLEIARQGEFEWYLYMDMPYGLAIPTTVSQRLAIVEETLDLKSLEPFSGNPDVKRLSMKRYVSQYGPTKRSHRRGFRAAMKAPERYWRVAGETSGSTASY